MRTREFVEAADKPRQAYRTVKSRARTFYRKLPRGSRKNGERRVSRPGHQNNRYRFRGVGYFFI